MLTSKKIIYFLTIQICSIGILSAQSVNHADSLFAQKQYTAAYQAYQKLHKKKPKDKQYLFKMGETAYLNKQYPQSIEHLQILTEEYPKSNQILGEIYIQQYNFEAATKHLTQYLEGIDSTDTQLIRKIKDQIEKTTLATKLMKRVEDVQFVDSIVVFHQDILRHIPLSKENGKLKQENELTQYTTERGDKTIGTDYYDHNIDLYTLNKLLDNSTEKKQLKELNTAYDENYPFLLMDGVTLYYASNGDGSIGGYDIFITRLDRETNSYLKPENIGMPFNSPYNDYLMVIDEVQNIGWFVSDRYQPEEKVAIYRFIPKEEKNIIKTTNIDTLVQKASLSTFAPTAQILTQQTTTNNKLSDSPKHNIFIKNNTYYHSSKDFKNNKARNSYHQSIQIEKNILQDKKELQKLRSTYRTENNPNKKESIGAKIRILEQKVQKNNAKKKIFEKNMRNEEIKADKNL